MARQLTDIQEGTIMFDKYMGEGGLFDYIQYRTLCKDYSGEGISIRLDKKTAILRSVDNTDYYCDDLSEPEEIEYTLFGKSGDQSLESRGNKQLIDPEKIQHIYVYRVKKLDRNKNLYVWYGKYEIQDRNLKPTPHIDINKNSRNIYILKLKKISN